MDGVNNSGQNVQTYLAPDSEHYAHYSEHLPEGEPPGGQGGGIAIPMSIHSIRQMASGEGLPFGPHAGVNTGGLGGEAGGKVMEAMEPMLNFLIGMLADEGTSAEDKGRILDLLKDLKAMVDESGDQEVKNGFNNILQNGYNELLNDPNVAPGDLMNLAELIDGTSTEDLQQRAQNEKNNAANNSNNNANNNDNAVV